jgi:hypothetical protein
MEQHTIKRIPVFPTEILQKVIGMQDVKDRLENGYVLTPYHHQILLFEINAHEEKKQTLAAKLRLEDGTLSKAKKHKPERDELVLLIRNQQDLQKLLAHAKALYYNFKKLRDAGTIPQDLQDMFKIVLDKLWAARRAQQQANRMIDIEANLEKHLSGFNTKHHKG